MALQNLILPILSVFRTAGLQQASGALRGLAGNFDSLASKIGLAAGSFGAFSALTAARQFTIDSVNATARFERNILGLNQVFENVTPQIAAFTKQVENYGLSQGQAAQASVFLGSVLKQYGFSVQQSADETERLVTLAQDLATTYGYDLQEALLAITALFRGEYDPIEKFGVAMKQSEVNARLAAEGLGDLKGEALANAQATARLTMLFERANDAVGAFGRASDTLYASQQRLNAIIGNLQLAFGAPLQKPLAQINQAFADLAQEFGPQVVEIAEALGDVISNVTPLIRALGQSFFLTIAPLQQLIELLGLLTTILSAIATPVLQASNSLLDILVKALDVVSSSLQRSSQHAGELIEKLVGLQDVDFEQFTLPPLIDLDAIGTYFDRLIYKNKVATGQFYDDVELGINGVRRLSAAELEAATSANKAAEATSYFKYELELLNLYSKDAEGKLTGLAEIFNEIDTAARKSEASAALQEIGFGAAQIENILTRPNWEAIFGEIKRLALLAAIDITKVMSLQGAALISAAQRSLEELREKGFGGPGGDAGKNYVAEFFNGIREGIRKETARATLIGMGASEGLVNAILGSQEWEKVYKRIIATGKPGLQDLQRQFNKTAAGIKEMADAAKDAREETERLAAIGEKVAEDFIAPFEKAADEAQSTFEQLDQAAKDFKQTISDFATIEILPTIDEELGRFESAVVGSVDKIRSELKSAFRQDLIYQSDFDTISAFVAAEEAALRDIAKQRDAMAKKLSLSEALIGEYQKALTGALQLTSLFNKLKGETEKRTVTEIQSGVVRLGRALREFQITVSRSYEEPIEIMQNKTEGLLQGFRDMAQKSRDFAENLRRLKALGLDPMLFAQLIEAGAEAGGETAQAIVDGGSEAVNELNGIFNELNKLGAELGRDVGMTMFEAGKDMTYGLLDGIKSEQERLLAAARDLATKFSQAFQSQLNLAIDTRVSDAGADAAMAAANVPDIKAIDVAALGKISELLKNAVNFASTTQTAFQRIRTDAIIEIFQGLEKDLLNRVQVDVSGIRGGMSVEDLVMAAKLGGGQTINNFNLEVYAESRASAAKAGEEIVNKITSFTRANGPTGGGLIAQVV